MQMTFSDKEFRKWIDCPECGGEGRCEYTVAKPDYIHGGELVGEMMECQTCEGYGEIELDYDEDDEELSVIVLLERAGSIH